MGRAGPTKVASFAAMAVAAWLAQNGLSALTASSPRGGTVVKSQAKSSGRPSLPDLRLSWDQNFLAIHDARIPSGRVEVNYLEAYCRSGSTRRVWDKTVIPATTEKLEQSADGKLLRLLSELPGGVEVRHEIRAQEDEVSFGVSAVNRGNTYADVVWAQPCIRVGAFTGRGQQDYTSRSFIFVNGNLTMLDQTRRTKEALYQGGQVYVPPGINLEDVNPRPLSRGLPSSGLIGCFSSDGRYILATAWEPYQELFQGVLVCLHSDFQLGGLKPGETKTARGKIYIMENDIKELERRYRRDFLEKPRAEVK
jgi:hypothetical protein